MSSCKLICKAWYIILLCGDCAADQMSFCSSTRFFILIRRLCDFDLFSVKQLYQWLGPVHCKEEGSLPLVSQAAGREQLLLAHSPSCRGAGTAGTKLGTKLGRGMFTDQGLAAPWRHRSLSPLSSVLQGEDLKTKMLALNFKNSR